MFWTTVSVLHGIPVVAFHGDLDFSTAGLARRELEGIPGFMIIDLAKCEFMDCAGLRALRRFRIRAALSSPRGAVARLLSVLEADRDFLIWDT